MKSVLTKRQVKKEEFKGLMYQGEKVNLTVNLRYDDSCKNGHNTFSITGDLYKFGRAKTDGNMISCGCIHDIIIELAPQYEHLIKWHLMSSDEPMHYIANTIYHASKIEKYNHFVYLNDDEFKFKELLGIYKLEEIEGLKNKYGKDNIIVESKEHYSNKESNLESARSTAIAPNASLEQLQSKEWLLERLPQLKQNFKKDIEALGFIY